MKRFAAAALLSIVPWLGFAQTEPTGPQAPLPEKKITIVTSDGKRHDFSVEVAATQQQQATGLMFRRSVPEGHGMLFDWHEPQDTPMWMKNTLVPLDMIFVSSDGRVAHLAENTVPQSLATIPSGGPVRATIEVAAGTAEKLDIRVGDKVEGAF